MSLINQVLRDLDKRHANASPMPAAVKAPAAAVDSAGRWRVAIVASAALLAVGATAGAVAWTLGARPVPAASPMQVTAPVAPAPAPVPAPTPVVVVASPVAAPAASAVPAVTAAPAATPTAAAPVPQDTWPARTLVSAPPAMVAPAAAPVAEAPAPATRASAPAGESRIEKRAPARTAQERAEADYQRGVAAHQQGQWTDAAAAYAAALREAPRFASARQALAGLLVGQGRADDATALLVDGVALSPQHAGLALMLARLHVERGALPQAADVLQAAAIASPTPEDRAFHAAVLQRLNRHAEAAELFAAAVRVTPTNGVWWMGLGISLAADGRNDTAREAFNRARSSGSLSPELASYVEQRLRQLL
jgi:MSHA biogenesis protein MshN